MLACVCAVAARCVAYNCGGFCASNTHIFHANRIRTAYSIIARTSRSTVCYPILGHVRKLCKNLESSECFTFINPKCM